jgi:hypothetical protein
MHQGTFRKKNFDNVYKNLINILVLQCTYLRIIKYKLQFKILVLKIDKY